jgi:hypothetical protein
LIESIISYRRLLNNDGTIKVDKSMPTEEGGSDPRLPITIEHPLLTSRSLYKQLVLVFGEDDLQLEHIWGKSPHRSHIRSSEKQSSDDNESESDGQWDVGVDDEIDSDDDDDNGSTMRHQPPEKGRPHQQARLHTTTTIPPPQIKYQSHHKPRLPTTSMVPAAKKSKPEAKRSLQFDTHPPPTPKKRKGKKQ